MGSDTFALLLDAFGDYDESQLCMIIDTRLPRWTSQSEESLAQLEFILAASTHLTSKPCINRHHVNTHLDAVLEHICFPFLSHGMNGGNDPKVIQFISQIMILEPKMVGQRLLKNMEELLTIPASQKTSLEQKKLSDSSAKNLGKVSIPPDPDGHLYRVLKVISNLIESLSKNKAFESGLWSSKLNSKWITLATLLIVDSRKAIRTIAGLQLIPALLKLATQSDIDGYWNRLKLIYQRLPSNHVDTLEVLVGSICRSFDVFLGLDALTDESTGIPQIRKDIRIENVTYEMILSGLCRDGTTLLKYCLYLLKRIVSFSEKYSPIEPENKEMIFSWPTKAASVKNAWEEFFFLFDTVGEPSIHLVEPHLPKLFNFLQYTGNASEAKMHVSWWIVLLVRTLNNSAVAVHRKIMERLVHERDPKVLSIWARETTFFFDHLLPTLQDSSFYEIPGRGEFHSPFGETVSDLVVSLIISFSDKSSRIDFLTKLLVQLSSFKNRLPLIFILQGLSFYANHVLSSTLSQDRIAFIGDDELKHLQSFLDDSSHAATLVRSKSAHQILSKWTLHIISAFCDPSKTTFRALIKFLAKMMPDSPISDADDVKVILESIQVQFPKNWFRQECLRALRSFLVLDKSEPGEESEPVSLSARELAITFLLVLGERQITPDLLSGIQDRISRVSSPYLPAGAAYSTARLLYHLCKLDHYFARKHLFSTVSRDHLVRLVMYLVKEAIYSPVPEDFEYAKELLDMVEYFIIDQWTVFSSDEYVDTIKDNVMIENSFSAPSLRQYMWMRLIIIAIRRYNYNMDPHCVDMDDILDILNRVKSIQFKKVIQTAADMHRSWNEFQSMYDETRHRLIGWINLDLFSKNDDQMHDASIDTFAYSVEQLDHATGPTADAIFDNLMNLIATETTPMSPSHFSDSLVASAISKGLEVLESLWSNHKEFTTVLETFCYFCFHPLLLSRPEFLSADTENVVVTVVKKMISWSMSRTELLTETTRHLYTFWLSAINNEGPLSDLAMKNLMALKSIFCDLLVYGPVRDKGSGDSKEDGLVALKAAQMKQDFEEKSRDFQGTAAMGFHLNEYMIRVHMNDLLLRLNRKNPEHVAFAVLIVDELLARHADNVQSFGARFIDSEGQRISTRIWCSIMILVHFIPEEQANIYVSKVLDAIELDQLTEVRSFIEWAAVRLLMRYPNKMNLDLLWQRLQCVKKKSFMTMSFMMIAIHLTGTLPPDQLKEYIEKAMSEFLPWCSCHHFAIRLVAQFALEKLHTIAITHPALQDSLDAISHLSSVLSFYKFNPDSRRHLQKCYLKYFMGGGFDPAKDFNVEFLFCGAFDVLGLADDEKISSVAFLRLTPNAESVYNMDLGYVTRKSTRERLKTILEQEKVFDQDFEESRKAQKPSKVTASASQDEETEFDVSQKKIVPWEGLIDMDLELVSGLERQAQNNVSRSPLIVCASLISLVPNLGGLCRTCEIFNAELLVVNNIKVAEEPAFIATSVTSGSWMPLKEVREDALESYLLEMKSQGYTLIGLEQANKSVPLQDFVFPQKSLLLLGKEREGIPVEYMPLLDSIVEIPQFGIIRSLNVHVSGALLIWEYTKQMMHQQKNSC